MLQNEDIDPALLITPTSGTIQGWRKTIKLTAPDEKKMIFTIGEGPMFEDSESDYEFQSVESSVPVGTVSKPIDSSVHVESLISAESLFNSMISDFNNMNSFWL